MDGSSPAVSNQRRAFLSLTAQCGTAEAPDPSSVSLWQPALKLLRWCSPTKRGSQRTRHRHHGIATQYTHSTAPPLMALLSKSAQSAVAGAGGGYLNPSKISAGSSVRFALLSDEPLEMYEAWGEGPDGKAKPFRFASEPTPDDITMAMGDYTRRLNREGTGFEPVKFAIALPVYNYEAAEVQVLSLTQKSIIRELDSISQTEDYADITAVDFTLGKEGSGLNTEYKLLPCPRKKGADAAIETAWSEAKAAGFDLERMMTGGNPFKADA